MASQLIGVSYQKIHLIVQFFQNNLINSMKNLFYNCIDKFETFYKIISKSELKI